VLHFDKINGAALITLNGHPLGNAINSFLAYHFTLSDDILREPGQENILQINIEPATDYIAR